MKSVTILGAGIAGLSMGAELKRAGMNDFVILEKNSTVPKNFKNGVHYLESGDVDFPFHFPLKKIFSVNQIWNPFKDTFKDHGDVPDILQFSLKVMGIRHISSITYHPGRDHQVESWLPESNNLDDLVDEYIRYIGLEHFEFGCDGTLYREGISNTVVISSIPLPLMMPEREFISRPIYVVNYPALDIVADLFINLYIPHDDFIPYRITVVNKIISMESVIEQNEFQLERTAHYLMPHFRYDLSQKSLFYYPIGRIWGLDSVKRKEVDEMFKSKNVYLIGRFGQWNSKLTIDKTIKQTQQLVQELKGIL